MSEKNVQYTMSLKDMLTPKLHEAEGHANKFEHSLHQLEHTGVHMMEALGISFALFKGIDFIEQGVEAFHQLHQAEAQVEAALRSTHEAAGLTFEELESGAKSLTEQFEYTRSQIFDMQSVMLTFTSITKDKFGEAEQAVLDMATRMHQDLQTTTVQVGKALQDPIRGITALRRVGVNFNETQTAMVKHMVNTGHAAKAQAYILHELATEFGGSAKAAADVDPLFKFNKLMAQIKLEVGGLATKLLHELTPALEAAIGAVKSSISWMKEHKTLMTALGYAVGTATAALVVWKTVTMASIVVTKISAAWTAIMTAGYAAYAGVSSAASKATIFWTGVQWLLNAALSANPIGLVIIAISAMVGAVIYAWNKWGAFRAFLMATWGVIKEFGRIVGDVFTGLWHQIHGIFTFNVSEIKSGFAQTANAMLDAGTRMATAYKKGWDEGMADFNKDHEKQPGQVEAPKKEKHGAAAMPTTVKEKGPKASSSGTKNISIKINIAKMMGAETIQVNNIAGASLAKIKEAITEVVTSAINDSQITAGD